VREEYQVTVKFICWSRFLRQRNNFYRSARAARRLLSNDEAFETILVRFEFGLKPANVWQIKLLIALGRSRIYLR
jgi:hypothetical protein